MTRAFHATDRAVIRISGDDARKFLQDLVTNDVNRIAQGPVYAALLTAQGKYLADFLMLAGDGGDILLDVAAEQAPGLVQRLSMYRLRAKVVIEQTALSVVIGLGAPLPGAHDDPRSADLGWRLITDDPEAALAGSDPLDPEAWEALRIGLGIPAAGKELIANDSYILEMGFERLHGVDFRKGCYVGQEVTARMRHKTELRKGLVRVTVAGDAAPGTDITAGDKIAGHLRSRAGNRALAYLRFDRAQGPLAAGDATLTVVEE